LEAGPQAPEETLLDGLRNTATLVATHRSIETHAIEPVQY
jgi:hypothetical protein